LRLGAGIPAFFFNFRHKLTHNLASWLVYSGKEGYRYPILLEIKGK